jgi:hypothetical protein
MSIGKAKNLLKDSGAAEKVAAGEPVKPLPRVAIAAHLADAAAAVEGFVARVPVYFDRVDGGFESPSPSGPLGTEGRYSSAWDTPDTLGRAIDAICEIMFEVRAFEVEAGEIRRGMDGAWLVPHSRWSCDPPWTALCLEMIEVGKAIVEKKVEVQVGFQREGLSFKWVSDATMTWAEGVAKWLRKKHDEVRGDTGKPHLLRVVQADGQPFFVLQVHLKILAALVAAKRAVRAVDLHAKIGSGVEHTRDVCREMEATVPPLIVRSSRNSGFGVTDAGATVLRERSGSGTDSGAG